MSQQRRNRRAAARVNNNHYEALASHLESFYKYLETDPQPLDVVVRDTFKTYEKNWKKYCSFHKLTEEAKFLFVRNVDEMWKRKALRAEKAIN